MYKDDCLGVSVQQLDPLGRATTFSYDPAGRQMSILDARGVETTFQYDAANRLTRRMSTNDPPVTFGYDPVGNRIEAVVGTGRSTFTYDLLNRRTGAVDPAGHTITYGYNGIGPRVGMAASQIGQFTYAYAFPGQISHLINPQGDRTTFSYDSAGRRTGRKGRRELVQNHGLHRASSEGAQLVPHWQLRTSHVEKWRCPITMRLRESSNSTISRRRLGAVRWKAGSFFALETCSCCS